MSEEAVVAMRGRLRRHLTDRRRPMHHSLWYGAIVHGRRRGPRRREDHRGFYIDWYDQRLFGVTIAIFLLGCLDAIFTLMLLERGAEEINPFMAALLEHSVQAFTYTKLGITGIGLVFLVVHAAFRVAGVVQVRQILYTLLGGYAALLGYQIGLLAGVF